MKPFFQTFEPVLLDGESLKITLEKTKDGLSVLIQPVLTPIDPDELEEHEAQLRANLAYPLTLKGTACELDDELPKLLTPYAQARQELASNINDVLDNLKEASKSAKAGGKSSGKSTSSVKKPVRKPAASQSDDDDEDSDTSAVPVSASVSNPDSL